MREINEIELHIEMLEKRMIAHREAIDELLDADLKLADIVRRLVAYLSNEKHKA